jgi:hypothetical protein
MRRECCESTEWEQNIGIRSETSASDDWMSTAASDDNVVCSKCWMGKAKAATSLSSASDTRTILLAVMTTRAQEKENLQSSLQAPRSCGACLMCWQSTARSRLSEVFFKQACMSFGHDRRCKAGRCELSKERGASKPWTGPTRAISTRSRTSNEDAELWSIRSRW